MNIPHASILNPQAARHRQAWIVGVLILALALFLSINRHRLSLALSSGSDLAHPAVNRTVPKVAPPRTGLHFSDPPTAAEFLRTGVFDQPLVPVGKPSADENRALARALIAFRDATARSGPDAVEPVVGFIDTHPDSAWTPVLLLNLGTRYRQTGHFSKTLELYQRAWSLTQNSTDANGILIGDMAAALLSQFEGYLGRTELLEPLLAQIKGRPLHGTAVELVSDSYRGLAEMHHMPQTSFRCGPMALARILYYHGQQPPQSVVETLEQSYSTPGGSH